MSNEWVLKPEDFPFEFQEFGGENIEWSWLYNYANVELWNDNRTGA
jgi:hypothetical protein